MAVAGLGSMCNVAKQCAQTVMRADGLLQALGERASQRHLAGQASQTATTRMDN